MPVGARRVFRVTVNLAPYYEGKLRQLASRGAPSRPRALAAVVVDAICFMAGWAEAHPNDTPDAILSAWKARGEAQSTRPRQAATPTGYRDGAEIGREPDPAARPKVKNLTQKPTR